MYMVVLITCPIERAESLAKALVEKRLAACVNILSGVSSIFWSEGKMDEAKESLLVLKSKASLLNSLVTEAKKAHPYEVPEIIALPIIGGFEEYLDWVGRETVTV